MWLTMCKFGCAYITPLYRFTLYTTYNIIHICHRNLGRSCSVDGIIHTPQIWVEARPILLVWIWLLKWGEVYSIHRGDRFPTPDHHCTWSYFCFLFLVCLCVLMWLTIYVFLWLCLHYANIHIYRFISLYYTHLSQKSRLVMQCWWHYTYTTNLSKSPPHTACLDMIALIGRRRC